MKWVHQPYTGKLKDGTCLLFENAFLEMGSKTPWFVIPMIWVPVTLLCLYYAWLHYPVLQVMILALNGVFFWTLIEYTLHRFVFHADEKLPDHWISRCAHFLAHGIHHKVPNDHYRLVFPPAPGSVLITIVGYIIYIIYPVSLPAFFGIMGGGLLGYVCYDCFHYACHFVAWPEGSACRRMKTYHMRHHYHGLHHQGFGVTSKFWDVVFNTSLPLGATRVQE